MGIAKRVLAGIMLLGAASSVFAQGPILSTVSAIQPTPNQTITITGSGFGTQSAYNGDTAFIRITDETLGWNAGWTGNNPADFVTLSISSWTDTQIVVSGFTGDYGDNNWTLNDGDQVTVSVWNPQTDAGPDSCWMTVGSGSGTNCGASKAIGDCGCTGVGQPQEGDPVTLGTGNLFEQVTDYTTTGANPLAFTRYYNSQSNLVNATFAVTLGVNWRHNYDRYLLVSPLSVVAERGDGQQVTFNLTSGKWIPDSDIDETLAQSGSTWTLTDNQDTVETYTAVSSTKALLTSVKTRNGYTQKLTYNGSGQLTTVTDSYSRTLGFTYTGTLLDTVTTPDGTTLTYGFTSSGVTAGKLDRLASVTYSTTPATSQTYLYENAALPFALTGIEDEDNNRFATWAYDANTRATSSEHGDGADLTTFTYNSDGTTTVTNALGVADTYTFKTLQRVPKATEISRAATSTTAAATETFTYDSNGYTASQTDWNGNQTTYVNNSHGLPTTVDEAVGTNAARTTTIVYDSTWVRLPASITTDGLTTAFTYDNSGEVLTRTLTDTTTTSAPYSTKGQTRTTTNTWSNYLLASTQTPNGNTTQFGYDGSGALTSITDALNHVTQITSHTGGGLPETIVDPNGVTTTLTYDPRQRRTSSTITGSTGTYKTSWTYDAAGNLTQTTLPDNSYLANTYDTAHRLTKVTDALGNYTSYTLDALGDRTQTAIYSKAGTLAWQRSGTFDALGRELVETAGAGQTTTKTYDPNGNVLTVIDGLSHTTTNTYDALNRLNTSTDANGGVTTPAYDTHNRIISVTDANKNATSYIRDGFGDVIQQTSPDSGITVFHYDGDANLTSKTDALSSVTNQTFDALDRPLTTAYPSDTAENVAYTYDQTGTGFSFGIGRLTSVTDAAGSLTRQYEERGNLLTETRINGKSTLTTGYTYDGASRIASMTYPDGTLVNYQHDAAGYVTTVSAQLPGATAATSIAALTHQPFGPMNTVTYGNGISETWSFDKSYRPTNITDVLSGTGLQNLTYAYDNANNVKSITDALNAANTQTLGYDVINRLTSATSGAGGYGSYSWTYDKVGNRLTQVLGSTSTSYGYTSSTNRLATITTSTSSALLRVPFRKGTESGTGVQARITPDITDTPALAEQPAAEPHATSVLASILGWPMLLIGIAGIVGFRKRLLKSPLLAILITASLGTGSITLLIGCGNSSKTAAAPTFSPAAGTFTSAQSVTISDSTTGTAIYYSTDGTTPTTSSTKYSAAIKVSSTETIQAIAVAPGYKDSAIASATYTINVSVPQAATPTFSPAAGSYSAAQSVTISDSTTGATIYFTTDGSTPTASSSQYTEPIAVSGTETIQAIAVASGYTNSAAASATYTISTPSAAVPTFAPVAGTYTSAQSVTISDSTPGVTIYFTTDGTNPTTSSTQYSAPITVSATETIKAIAAASGYATSAIASATYTINISTSSSTVTVITNANGNITSIPPANGTANATFTYNAANRLSGVTGTPTTAASYVYDYAGKRITKTTSGSTPILYSYTQDGSLIAENNSGMLTDYVYVDGRPIAVLQPGGSSSANQVDYILADHSGTPQQSVNNGGTTVWSASYTPFGDAGNPANSIIQNLRLPGQYNDAETAFHYNLYRDYMPNLGRYLETDPIGLYGGVNSYAYAYGNPYTFTDRTGLAVVNPVTITGFCAEFPEVCIVGGGYIVYRACKALGNHIFKNDGPPGEPPTPTPAPTSPPVSTPTTTMPPVPTFPPGVGGGEPVTEQPTSPTNVPNNSGGGGGGRGIGSGYPQNPGTSPPISKE